MPVTTPMDISRRAADPLGQPSCVVASDNFLFNSAGLTPCDMAAQIYKACGTNNFTVDPLTGGDHYTPGDPTHGIVPSPCSCSWVAYNTLSGCSACQYEQGITSSIIEWQVYKTDCQPSDLQASDGTWFPPSFIIPNKTAIPAWAQHDPTTWTDQRFNIADAQAITGPEATAPTASSSNNATSSATNTSSPSHSAPIGAIVGGVVGGIALIAAVVAFLIWNKLSRKRKDEKRRKLSGIMPLGTMHKYNGSLGSPQPGALLVDSPPPGQLASTVQRNGIMTVIPARESQAMPSHSRQTSDETMFSGGHYNVPNTASSPPLLHSRKASDTSLATTSRLPHNRTHSDQSIDGQNLMPTPWTPTDGGERSAAGHRSKAREAASESFMSTDMPGPSGANHFTRRFNPPTYENALAASPSTNRPTTTSNDSSTDLSSVGVPVPTFEGVLTSLPTPISPSSPAVASSAVQPPGLGLRLASVDEMDHTHDFPPDVKQ